MKTTDHVGCVGFPCADVAPAGYALPSRDVDPAAVRIVMVSEAPPADPAEYMYAPGMPFHLETTLQAFSDAGQPAESLDDLLRLGVYLTTAVKCAKTAYGILPATIETCSHLLVAELALFPEAKVYMLMGDVAIRALNGIAKRAGARRVVPAGATYKIRAGEFTYGDVRVFPSYVQTGKGYLIEKSKQRMIAEDIRAALAWAGGG